MDTLIPQINKIFIDILDNEDITITRETSANDIEEWDSLSHIQLIVAIEKQLKIKFTSMEITKWKNVGEMCDTIKAKLG